MRRQRETGAILPPRFFLPTLSLGVGIMHGSMLWLLVLVADPGSRDVEAAMRRVLAAGEYQTRLPEAAAPQRQEDPRKRAGFREGERDAPDMLDQVRGVVGKAVVWILVIVFTVLVLTWIISAYRNRRRPAPVRRETDAPGPAAPVPLSPPERLAKGGLWAEAIRATLLLLLRDLPKVGTAPSWTSREILRRVRLPGHAMEPLRKLVVLVERCLFAGERASEVDYRHAREYERDCRRELAA